MLKDMVDNFPSKPFSSEEYPVEIQNLQAAVNHFYNSCNPLQTKFNAAKEQCKDDLQLHQAEEKLEVLTEYVEDIKEGSTMMKLATQSMRKLTDRIKVLKGRVQKRRTDKVGRSVMKLTPEELALATKISDFVVTMPDFDLKSAKALTTAMDTDDSDTDIGSDMSDESGNFREAAQKPRPQPPRHLPTTTATRSQSRV